MTSQVVGGLGVFEWKGMFFQLLSAIKVKLVDKMMQILATKKMRNSPRALLEVKVGCINFEI